MIFFRGAQRFYFFEVSKAQRLSYDSLGK